MSKELSTREYFIGQIIKGLYSNPSVTDPRALATNTCFKTADKAIQLADELMKKLNEQPNEKN